jgi:hypothetical protein
MICSSDAFRTQELHDIHVPILACDIQRGQAFAVRPLSRTLLMQECHDGVVSMKACIVKGRGILIVTLVLVTSGSAQDFHNLPGSE